MNDIFVVPLSNSPSLCLISGEDAEEVMKHRWRMRTTVVGFGYIRRVGREEFSIFLHNSIMKSAKNQMIDHKNHFKFDNRRCNLRLANPSLNTINSRKRPNTSSKYKGVVWNKRSRKWQAYLNLNGIRYSLGYHLKEDEAALAYNQKAIELFKDYAQLNEVPL